MRILRSHNPISISATSLVILYPPFFSHIFCTHQSPTMLGEHHQVEASIFEGIFHEINHPVIGGSSITTETPKWSTSISATSPVIVYPQSVGSEVTFLVGTRFNLHLWWRSFFVDPFWDLRKIPIRDHLIPKWSSEKTGWWFEPLWKIWTSIGMISNPIYGIYGKKSKCSKPPTRKNLPVLLKHSPLCMLMSTPAVKARRAASRPSAAKPWWISSSSAV